MVLARSPALCGLRRRARSRGFVYVEYLIVAGFVFISAMIGFYKLGPGIVKTYRLAAKIVVEQAP